MEIEKIEQTLEGLLFVAGGPLAISDIMDKLELQKSEVMNAYKKLSEKYSGDSGIHIMLFNGKLQLGSNPVYGDLIATVLNPIKEKELSRASMEVAAIVAYKQPITRLEIEQVRGVNSDYALSTLASQNIVTVVGRKDVVGKPLLYGTTDEFLKRFNLSTLADLPDYDELIERIKVIESPKTETADSGLYNNFEIPDEEETPEFLEGETDLQKIE